MDGNYIKITNVRTIYNRRFKVNSTEFNLFIKDKVFENDDNSISTDVSDTESEEYPLIDVDYLSNDSETDNESKTSSVKSESDIGNEDAIFEKYSKCFDEMLDFARNELMIQPRDYIGVKIHVPSVANVVPIGLRYLEMHELSSEMIVDLLMSVQQSNAIFTHHNSIEIVISVIQNSTGGYGHKLTKISLDNYKVLMKNKSRSILESLNDTSFDDLKCLPRSLILAQYWIDCEYNRKLFDRFYWRKNLVSKKTDELIKKTFGKTHIFDKNYYGGIVPDLMKFIKQLKGYQILVYDDESFHHKPIFRTKRSSKKMVLFFFREKKHFIALSNVKAFFGLKYMCELCDKLSNTRLHRCHEKCSNCFSSPPCFKALDDEEGGVLNKSIQCLDCFRYFKGEQCLSNHKIKDEDNKYSVCERFSICQSCFKFIDQIKLDKEGIKEHLCNQIKCINCKKIVINDHGCTIKPYKKSMPKKFVLYFYDIETVQKKEILDNKNRVQYLHEAIVLCVHKVCHLCWHIDDKFYSCIRCKQREFIFEGRDCIIEFLTLLIEDSDERITTTCIAHNAKSFDAQLFMNYILKIKYNQIKVIMQGCKILRIQFRGYINFIDSLMFLTMPLSKFQETFDLDPNLSKGFFPYLFLSFDNWMYKGDIPDAKYFGINLKVEKESKEYKRAELFCQWYNKRIECEYDLRLECLYYCSNDVTILRLGCLKFMKIFMDLAEINPFFECFTLAQLALLIYRKKFMPENKLGIIPENNYQLNTIQSQISRKWLIYLNYFQDNADKYDFFIEYEKRLSDCNLIVDGFCMNYPFKPKNLKGTVFEFSGCYYHGCPKCLKNNTLKLRKHTNAKFNFQKQFEKSDDSKSKEKFKTLDQFEYSGSEFEDRAFLANQDYQRTRAKLNKLQSLGYHVIHCWEHNFKLFLKSYPDIDEKISQDPSLMNKKLLPRDGLYGGRNEAGRLYYKVDGVNEKIRFYDYCSLYSYSMLNGKYFVNKPIKILTYKQCQKINLDYLLKIDGIAYVKVLPNADLFFPVLPYRSNNKLMFPSCRSCVDTLNIDICNHNVDERAISGVWSLCELKAAFERNYKLLEIYEVWEYETETGQTNLNDEVEITYDYLMQLSASEETVEKKEKINNKKKQKQKQKVNKKSVGFFTDYQNTFIRLKGEASGFPNHCKTLEDKQLYIVDFYKINKVILRMDLIEKNEPKRQVAKSLLNSLYGKLCQKEKNMNTSVLNNRDDLLFYVNSDMHEIMDIYCPNENYSLLTWKYCEDADKKSVNIGKLNTMKNICVTSGIQTTATARLHLLTEIEKLGDRCLYMDTDSMIFIEKKGCYMPKLSPAIGGLCDDIERYREKGSSFTPVIVEVCIIAPKTYAFKVMVDVNKYIHIVKCKGLQLDSDLLGQVNMQTMKSYLLGENYTKMKDDYFYHDKIQTKKQRISCLKNFRIVTRDEYKQFGFTFDKRVVGENLITYPYGFNYKNKNISI